LFDDQEPSGGQAPLNRALAEPQIGELLPRDPVELPADQFDNPSVLHTP
jgi:hypothetical protein